VEHLLQEKKTDGITERGGSQSRVGRGAGEFLQGKEIPNCKEGPKRLDGRGRSFWKKHLPGLARQAQKGKGGAVNSDEKGGPSIP